jgi:hypothetical protein
VVTHDHAILAAVVMIALAGLYLVDPASPTRGAGSPDQRPADTTELNVGCLSRSERPLTASNDLFLPAAAELEAIVSTHRSTV